MTLVRPLKPGEIADFAPFNTQATVLAAEHAAEHVCSAMEEHARSAPLQREACRALAALASASAVSAATLREARALAVVCAAMMGAG